MSDANSGAPASVRFEPQRLERSPNGDPVRQRWISAALLAITALWLLSPLFAIQHVEGFSASIDSLALHLAQDGSLRPYDRVFPFNLEFFATSRAGAVAALAGLHAVAPWAADGAFKVLVIGGLGLLAVGSMQLIRVWAGTGWLAAGGALVLMPGVFESSFIYNDNMLSSGLAVTSLALLLSSSKRLSALEGRSLLAGTLMGAAIFVRADAILMVPTALFGLWLQHRMRAAFWSRACSFALAAALVVILAPAPLGFSFIDTMTAARRVVGLWQRWPWSRLHAMILILFVGLPVVLLAAVGTVQLLRTRAWARLAFLVFPILLFNWVYYGKVWEARVVLPLTPFVGGLAAVGIDWIARSAPKGIRWGAIALLLALWLVPPPAEVVMREGPRVFFGRLWTPLIWGAWQQSVARDFETVRGVAATPRDAVIVTAWWNSDRYLHRELQRDGFRLDMSMDKKATCGGTTETFRRRDRVIRHLRLHTPHVYDWRRYMLPTVERFEASCGAEVAALPMFLLGEAETPSLVSPAEVPRSPFSAQKVAWAWRPLTLTPLDMPAIRALALREQMKDQKAGDTPSTLDESARRLHSDLELR